MATELPSASALENARINAQVIIPKALQGGARPACVGIQDTVKGSPLHPSHARMACFAALLGPACACCSLALAEEATTRFRDLGWHYGEALALNQLGTLWRLRRQHDRARRHLRHSLALRERLGDRRATGLTLGALGLLAAGEGDRHGAQRLLRQAHDLFERTEDRFAMAGMRINLGVVALRSGDLLEARRLLRTLFALRAGPGLLRPAGWAEVLLAEIADRRGDESAEGHLRRASELFAQLDERMGLAHCLRCGADYRRSRCHVALSGSFVVDTENHS
jgi:tetratricopeptide (TPR) repeat protein